VDLFVGTGTFQKLPLLLGQKSKKKSHLLKPAFLYDEETPRLLSTPASMAYLKIAEGCSRDARSAPYKDQRTLSEQETRSVLEEARKLADQGIKELILIAQDTTAYGEDLRDGTHLEKLLKGLVNVEGLRWIRILYAYPREDYFTDGLLETMAKEEKICPYIDLPIQHIDDEILKRMGRRTKSQEIRRLLTKIRRFIPGVALRTSLIVGFPGRRRTNSNRFSTLSRRLNLIILEPSNIPRKKEQLRSAFLTRSLKR